ncbi:hypothetical protein C8J57DRAFT_1476808 [Mycena rebaudengoi]|nr:hypothetical protein C8J57DRAFT_1476808 [Mycena rebaudengoi]
MPPLTRQQTLESVRSWWSDRNPNLRGPTINLHAAAKPLMRLLYDRQALEFIPNNRGLLLTSTAVEIYGSYLACEYVSKSTKSAILGDLSRRAQAEYGTLAEATLLNAIAGMLEAPGSLEWPYSTAIEIISGLALHESSAVAVAEGNILNCVEKHLRSLPTYRYHPIFLILESLVSHESTAMSVIRVLPLDLLGTRWRVDGTTPIDPLAMRWEQLVITKLLDAPHKAIAEATCGELVALVCDSDMPRIVDGALWLFSRVPRITFPPATIGISVETKLLDHIADMLKAPNTPKWRCLLIFQMLPHLALHGSSARVVVERNLLSSMEKLLSCGPTDLYEHIFPMLESLVSIASVVLDMCRLLANLWRECLDGDTFIINKVIGTLTRIARVPGGAEAVVTAKLLIDILNGLHSTYDSTRSSTCKLLRELVGYESAVRAVVAIVPRKDIVALFRYGSPFLLDRKIDASGPASGTPGFASVQPRHCEN